MASKRLKIHMRSAEYRNFQLSESIKWEKIISIKTLEPQHVYDLSIEGTRNFIANDIVAHNTYLATSSGNVGIGITSPSAKLDVNASIKIGGTDGVQCTIFVDSDGSCPIGSTLIASDDGKGICLDC